VVVVVVVVGNIVVPHADLVTLIRIHLWADFEHASTIIATVMTDNAGQGRCRRAEVERSVLEGLEGDELPFRYSWGTQKARKTSSQHAR
jgi:hypothetical protein